MVLEGLSVFVSWFHGGGGCFAFSVVSVWAMRNEWVVMTVGDTEALLTGWFLKTQLV
jgi:TRAP-type mannitol/chloroaromatic compound transport system substrate-binding protein